MAKLSAHAASGNWSHYDDFSARPDWQATMKKDDATLAKLEAEDKRREPGQIVGAIIRFPVADGYAAYRVSKEKPLMLEWIPFGDAWQADVALIRGLTIADVRKRIGRPG